MIDGKKFLSPVKNLKKKYGSFQPIAIDPIARSNVGAQRTNLLVLRSHLDDENATVQLGGSW